MMVTIVSIGGLVVIMETSVTVVWLTAILRVLVVLSLVVGLVVVVLSFEITLLNFVMRLLVVGIVVNMLADWLSVLGSDQGRVVSIEVHLRVSVLWLVVVLNFPSLVLLWNHFDVMAVFSVDWLIVVMAI